MEPARQTTEPRQSWLSRLGLQLRLAAVGLRSRDGQWTASALLFAFVIVTTGLYVIVQPMLDDWSTLGFHDWGTHTAYRYITVISVGEYGEAPWWHPYMCGGVPAVGLHGGAPNFISPWLPLYLGLEIQTALRLELLLSALAGMVGAWLLAGRFTKSIALKTLVVVMLSLIHI